MPMSTIAQLFTLPHPSPSSLSSSFSFINPVATNKKVPPLKTRTIPVYHFVVSEPWTPRRERIE
jgi:hypothetical protein